MDKRECAVHPPLLDTNIEYRHFAWKVLEQNKQTNKHGTSLQGSGVEVGGLFKGKSWMSLKYWPTPNSNIPFLWDFFALKISPWVKSQGAKSKVVKSVKIFCGERVRNRKSHGVRQGFGYSQICDSELDSLAFQTSDTFTLKKNPLDWQCFRPYKIIDTYKFQK